MENEIYLDGLGLEQAMSETEECLTVLFDTLYMIRERLRPADFCWEGEARDLWNGRMEELVDVVLVSSSSLRKLCEGIRNAALRLTDVQEQVRVLTDALSVEG
jgi:hypothetical protein